MRLILRRQSGSVAEGIDRIFGKINRHQNFFYSGVCRRRCLHREKRLLFSCRYCGSGVAVWLIKRGAVGIKNVSRNDLSKKTFTNGRAKASYFPTAYGANSIFGRFHRVAAGDVVRGGRGLSPGGRDAAAAGARISRRVARDRANKDWPSKPGLSVAEQKAELIALLDRAVQLKLNAIVFQVRPSSDAVYASAIEPWSEYLTGTMGRAPQPFYDPLAFAIEEAHRRGLELHAWFNPFRALHPQTKSPVAPNHISRTHPELVRRYGDQFWLDPGDPAVRAHVLRVVMDVVQRYDVDGVQFDDYFYPYPEKDAAGRELEFPDDATWQKFGLASGFSNRDDWRRANVNQFIHSVYQSIKAVKPWVKFGISPFGIWRPMNPPQIRGLDAYAKLYADSRLWLANGWLDYFAPQLYWAVEPKEQSFPALLNWWVRQNPKGRHLWPGLNAANVGEKWRPEEIDRQIKVMRSPAGRARRNFLSPAQSHGQSGLGHRGPGRISANRARAGVAVAGFHAAGQAEAHGR